MNKRIAAYRIARFAASIGQDRKLDLPENEVYAVMPDDSNTLQLYCLNSESDAIEALLEGNFSGISDFLESLTRVLPTPYDEEFGRLEHNCVYLVTNSRLLSAPINRYRKIVEIFQNDEFMEDWLSS